MTLLQPPPEQLEELRRYETHDRVFGQAQKFIGSALTTINIYVAVTGGFWTVLIPNVFRLSWYLRCIAFLVHVAISVAALLFLHGLAETVRQRLNFLKAMGTTFWPSIEVMGERAHDKTLLENGAAQQDRRKIWQLRDQLQVWAWIPSGAGVISLVAIILVVVLASKSESACNERFDLLMDAATPAAVARATFLLNDAACDTATTSLKSPTLAKQPPP